MAKPRQSPRRTIANPGALQLRRLHRRIAAADAFFLSCSIAGQPQAADKPFSTE